VGVYSRIGALPNTYAVLFTATPIGGALQTQSGETIDVRYFSFDEIPDNLSFGHQQRIDDARKGIGGSIAVTQEITLPIGQKISSQDIVEARKLPRESRLAFYRRVKEHATIHVKKDVAEK